MKEHRGSKYDNVGTLLTSSGQQANKCDINTGNLALAEFQILHPWTTREQKKVASNNNTRSSLAVSVDPSAMCSLRSNYKDVSCCGRREQNMTMLCRYSCLFNLLDIVHIYWINMPCRCVGFMNFKKNGRMISRTILEVHCAFYTSTVFWKCYYNIYYRAYCILLYSSREHIYMYIYIYIYTNKITAEICTAHWASMPIGTQQQYYYSHKSAFIFCQLRIVT